MQLTEIAITNLNNLSTRSCNLKVFNIVFQYHFDAHVTSFYVNRVLNWPVCCVGVIHLQISGLLVTFPAQFIISESRITPIAIIAKNQLKLNNNKVNTQSDSIKAKLILVRLIYTLHSVS